MDNVFLGVLTGTDPYFGQDIDIKRAVAQRFEGIKAGFKQQAGDLVYTGNRCRPTELGWRFIQNGGGNWTPLDIIVGKADSGIEATWHDAASAEHWYTYEKDWGYGPGMGAFGSDE